MLIYFRSFLLYVHCILMAIDAPIPYYNAQAKARSSVKRAAAPMMKMAVMSADAEVYEGDGTEQAYFKSVVGKAVGADAGMR